MPNISTSKRSQLTAVQAKSEAKAANRTLSLPKSLDSTMRAEWTAIIKYMKAADAWHPQKASMLETYLVNLQAMRQAQDRMTADGGVIMPDGKVHPASAAIARHSGFLTKLGPQLGLGRDNLIPSTAPKTTAKAKASTWAV